MVITKLRLEYMHYYFTPFTKENFGVRFSL